MIENLPKIAFLGFGEAARAFALGWMTSNTTEFSAFDVKSHGPDQDAAALAAALKTLRVTGHASAIGAARDVGAIFSLVTADQALDAAQSVLPDLPENCWFFDCNSCAPRTKLIVSQQVQAAKGRYVDVAVMAPVHPALHKTPVLISGDHTAEAQIFMTALDMNVTVIDGPVGKASSVKMIRSIMMKGLEALTAECVLAGRRAGVDELVLQSLEKTYPGFGWKDRAAHMLERMTLHGNRRAAEMQEVARTVDQLGLKNTMSKATAQWQQAIGALGLTAETGGYQAQADALIDALDHRPSTAEIQDKSLTK